MATVYGDKAAESAKLSRRRPEAQDFYVAMVGRPVPDNFGRFRLSPSHVAVRLYPKREATPGLLKRIGRLLQELGTGQDEHDVLWRTWKHDGVLFAEMTAWKASGNIYHRTPEPPWGGHQHTEACLPTAIARARQWGQPDEAERLSHLLRQLKAGSGPGVTGSDPAHTAPERGASGANVVSDTAQRLNGSGGGRADPPSVPSVPVVPSVPGTTIVDAHAREAETATADDGCAPYVRAVLDLYGQLPGTRAQPTPADRETATRLWERGIPLDTARAGLLTAAARRELRHREEPLPVIGSLRYFLDAIEEARDSPPDRGHVAYLASKLAPHMKPSSNGGSNGTLDGQ